MKKTIRLVFALSITVLLYSCSESQEENVDQDPDSSVRTPTLAMQTGVDNLLMPVPNQTSDSAAAEPAGMDREAVLSYVYVEPSDSLGALRQYRKGEVITLSLDQDLSISARINRNQALGEHIRNLTASILDPHEGAVTLSIDRKSMTGTIDLLSENRLFHIRYDSLSGTHYVAEIDRDKLDVIEGSEAIEPQ
ncbi:MAG: hypothetical protein GVY08_09065 [Bacteroidetes bacterium]|jgi:hypothetical protein|nr:hypothetical protein [Bacteroidota bacterium]